MKTQPTNQTWWNTWGNLLLPVVLALLFLAFTFSYYPFREKLQFDTDEGLNLMRSMLVALGYPLYSEVSSDQPPLFTELLALLLRVTGFEVNPARTLVLLFSTLLVWSGAQLLELVSGRMVALLFLPLVIMVPQYLRLSTSVMIGVPSIALATASMLFVVLWHQQRKDLWLILSGFALAFSVLIKLFTGFFVPIFWTGILIAEYFDHGSKGFSWKLIRPALIWSISFAGLALLLGLALVGPENIAAITSPHISAPTVEGFQSESFTMNIHLRAAMPLLWLGILGAVISLYRRNWLACYPIAWAAVAYGLFSIYSPVFYHHQLLITIPLTMLAALAVGEGILSLVSLRQFPDLIRFRTVLGVGALVGSVLVFIHYIPTSTGT
jgi:hypothetical protein